MQVAFGTVLKDPRYMDKPYSPLATFDCMWKSETSIEEPTIICTVFSGYARCNYFVIPEWNRRYFVTSRVVGNNNLLHISGKVDSLSTYADYIRRKNTLILRQENVWNPYIQDNELPVRTERIIEYQKVGSVGNPKGQNIILTVSGGYDDVSGK